MYPTNSTAGVLDHAKYLTLYPAELTEASDYEGSEEPRFRLDHLEQVEEARQREENDEDDRRDHGGVIVVELEVRKVIFFGHDEELGRLDRAWLIEVSSMLRSGVVGVLSTAAGSKDCNSRRHLLSRKNC